MGRVVVVVVRRRRIHVLISWILNFKKIVLNMLQVARDQILYHHVSKIITACIFGINLNASEKITYYTEC